MHLPDIIVDLCQGCYIGQKYESQALTQTKFYLLIRIIYYFFYPNQLLQGIIHKHKPLPNNIYRNLLFVKQTR